MIIFHGRIERALKFNKEKRDQTADMELGPDGKSLVPEAKPADNMEKGDLPAMILSALIVILPLTLVVLVVLALAGYFFVAGR